MKQIWSPWRMKFIQNPNKFIDGCIFCNLLKQRDGLENLIVYRGKCTYIVLNRYPYTTGHVMVIPYEHASTFELLGEDTLTETMKFSNACMHVLRELYKLQAVNLGANVGISAGAGIAEHVHMHIVLRWNGDNNFMSIIGDTRVLTEDLPTTYEKFSEKWKMIVNN